MYVGHFLSSRDHTWHRLIYLFIGQGQTASKPRY